MIKKQGDLYCVFTKDGSRRLGCHPTEERAKKQERVIQEVSASLTLDASPFQGPAAFYMEGKTFEHQGNRKFVKDLLRVGSWMHPGTNQWVHISRKRLLDLARDSNRWTEAGNVIRLMDGHPGKDGPSVSKVLGDFVGPMFVMGDTLYGTVVPKSDETVKAIEERSLDAVSVGTRVKVKSQSDVDLDEIVDHVAATPSPVVTGQGDFISLSAEMDSGELRALIPEALALSLSGGSEMKNRAEIAKALGLKEDATEEEILKAAKKKAAEDAEKDKAIEDKVEEAVAAKVEEAVTETTEKVAASLSAHGLTLKDGKVVKTDEAPETPREKSARERAESLEATVRKQALAATESQVKEAIASGKVPPSQKDRLKRLLSIQEKAMGLALGQGGDIKEVAVSVTDELVEFLGELPSINGDRLSGAASFGATRTEEEEKKSEELSNLGKDAARSVQPRKETAGAK
jgi:hypothetical protein